jgi:hypothetical protein
LFSTFKTSFIELRNNSYEIKQLENYYGVKWYEFFFTSYHINSQINNIKNNSSKKKSLELKLGKEWVNNFLNELIKKKVSYSYATSYYNYLLMKNKIKSLNKRKNEMDFRTYNSNKPQNTSQDTKIYPINPELLKQNGGDDFDDEIDDELEENITHIDDIPSDIDEEIISHIYDPFFSTKEEGMGMGLNICRSIIESHEGRLMAENNSNNLPENAKQGDLLNGCTFTILLPLENYLIPLIKSQETSARNE